MGFNSGFEGLMVILLVLQVVPFQSQESHTWGVQVSSLNTPHYGQSYCTVTALHKELNSTVLLGLISRGT